MIGTLLPPLLRCGNGRKRCFFAGYYGEANQDIARQNLARLDIGVDEVTRVTERLTMTAKYSRRLDQTRAAAGKPLNLVAFTPGTSFDRGWRTGRVEERAMLYVLLAAELGLSGWPARSARRALQGGVSTIQRFEHVVEALHGELGDGPDPTIAAEFARRARAEGLLAPFQELIERIGRRHDLPSELHERARELTGRLRATLAKASVESLEPDVIILDEFQRFRHLLSVEEGGEAAELAEHMFNYPQAKVLLLSATPYKPYTLADEATVGEDHYRDFFALCDFLCQDESWRDAVQQGLRRYRDAAVSGAETAVPAGRVREQLMQVMCRTERPAATRMLVEHAHTVTPSSGDLLGYHGLRGLAAEMRGHAQVEYWKSAPYFVNFMEDYQLGISLRGKLADAAERQRLAPLVERTQRIDPAEVRAFEPVDLGNARLRELAEQTVRRGWARLLWVPPSLPYHALRGPFAEPGAADMTKRLVFSSWTATPTAAAALLSYEAERELLGGTLAENTAEARRRMATRLDYRLDPQGGPAAMSTLALFWPHPALAGVCDPLAAARRSPGATLDPDELTHRLAAELATQVPAGLVDPDRPGEPAPWRGYLQWPGALPEPLAGRERGVRDALAGQADEADLEALRGLTAHVRRALELRVRRATAASSAERLTEGVAALGLHGPGNVAWRALGRLLGGEHAVTPAGHWRAAAVLASGLRRLFNRIESIALLDRLWPEEPYWQAVLRYSAAGCLQAVLDEYLHHLCHNQASLGALDDDSLLALASQAREAMAARPSTYRAFDPGNPEESINFTARFALRYGTRPRDQDSARPSQVRGAFNSPFWPFVLTTTSAGQEGIDFHWWAHAVVHWDIPANPVDFEQREGRVHRYGGHVIRRNIATRHRQAILAASGADPWDDAYRIAAATPSEAGEFAPRWVYPGPAHVERHLLTYPLSRDVTRATRTKEALALYRLAFGQPRQEDMVNLLARQGVTAGDVASIDLRPRPSTEDVNATTDGSQH
jgi:hypothetical protein